MKKAIRMRLRKSVRQSLRMVAGKAVSDKIDIEIQDSF